MVDSTKMDTIKVDLTKAAMGTTDHTDITVVDSLVVIMVVDSVVVDMVATHTADKVAIIHDNSEARSNIVSTVKAFGKINENWQSIP